MTLRDQKHVLFIEDSIPLQNALKRILRNCIITFATSVDNAIVLLRTIQFDVIISNYILDGHKTGEDLLHWITAHRPELQSRFIIFSGHPQASVLPARVVLKPFFDELRKEISEVGNKN